ncbi:MAG TPA: MmcQ/YjbR family DNA-binding protein [Acidobacteriaceae bacterium]|jgi:predicted DNA-binding protein (MmcQ/YjbR family)
MDTERARAYMLSLPHVVETMQWGDHLLFWVGDKAIGGRMFCLMSLGAGEQGVASFPAGSERFHELVEQDGLVPAPYLARALWIAAERWSALRNSEWEELLMAAHTITFAKLSKRTLEILAMPAKEYAEVLAEGRKKYAERAEKEKAAKAKAKAAKKASTKKAVGEAKKRSK